MSGWLASLDPYLCRHPHTQPTPFTLPQFLDGKPTYRFREGAIGESYALEVAERLELPPAVLERARGLMDEGVVKVTELVKELEAQRDALEGEIRAAREREEVGLEFKCGCGCERGGLGWLVGWLDEWLVG